MKKTISIVLIISTLLVGASSFVYADDLTNLNTMVFYYPDKEITVENPDGLDYETMKYIADSIAYGEQVQLENPSHIAMPANILCTLFGHNLTTSYVSEVTHNVYTTSPKCVKKTYEVIPCTRSSCDYFEKNLISSARISSCHG